MQLKELVGQLFTEPEYRGQCRTAKQQFLAANEDPERAKRAKVEEAPREREAEMQSQSASPASTGALLDPVFCPHISLPGHLQKSHVPEPVIACNQNTADSLVCFLAEPVEHDTSRAAIQSRLAAANTHYG